VRKFDLARRQKKSEQDAAAELAPLDWLHVTRRARPECDLHGGQHQPCGNVAATPGAISIQEAPQLCAAVANEYAAALDDYVKASQVSQAKLATGFLGKRQSEVTAKLARIDDQLESLQVRYQLLNPDAKAQALVDATKTVTEAYVAAQADAESAAHALSWARPKVPATTAMRISAEVTERNPVLQPLEQQMGETQARLATDLESGKSENHPDVLEKRAALRSLQEQVAQIKAQIKTGETTTSNPIYDVLVERVIDLEVALAGARAREKSMAPP